MSVKDKVKGWTTEQKGEVLDGLLEDTGILTRLTEKFTPKPEQKPHEKEDKPAKGKSWIDEIFG